MADIKVERLLVNYKTLEEFKQFLHYGLQELSMAEDLEDNIIENNSESPFYGIYYGDKLIARMSLYMVDKQYNEFFEPPSAYLELWKLEVLPAYQRKGFGKKLVEFAKRFNLPIRTNPRAQSWEFWKKMNFTPITYDMERDLGQEPLIWLPDGIKEKQKKSS